MKDLLQNLLQHLRRSELGTRLVIGASALILVAVAAVAATWAGEPHMVLLHTGLDDTQFSAVTRALAASGLRYDTSSPPGPYSVFVDESQRYVAQNAMYAEGALDGGPRGIPTDGGTSTIFLGKDERDQISLKRNWQELENQLKALSFVANAVVRTSPGVRSALLERTRPTVSVLVHLRGGELLTRMQRQTLASIVRNSTNVPDANITISDQHGNSLFDGAREEGLDAALQFEHDFTAAETRRAQDFLDRVFGPGLSAVSVVGEWNHDRRETVAESFDPTKLKVSETTSETRTPVEDGAPGGPAGTASNIDRASAPPAFAGGDPPVAETVDSDVRYAYGTSTTHTLQRAPELQRLAVTLTLDASLSDRLAEAEALVKDLVGFQERRDQMTATALPLFTVLRDADGNPVPPAPEQVPAPPNELVTLLLERGVELLAALAFLALLWRSLRKGAVGRPAAPAPSPSGSSGDGEDPDLDLELLARRQVEELIETDPEKVGALLSRWAHADAPTAGAER